MINVHAVSEHTFQTKHTSLELHMVHKRYDGDGLLIIAVPFSNPTPPPNVALANAPDALLQTESLRAVKRNEQAPTAGAAFAPYVPPLWNQPAFNPKLQPLLWKALPQPYDSTQIPTRPDAPMDLNAFLVNSSLFEYAGSMTSPPCMENAQWLVRTTPIMASDSQVNLFVNALYAANGGYGNYRKTMPLNGRQIRVFDAVRDEPPPDNPAPGWKANPLMDNATDALKFAKNITKYVLDMEWRLTSTTARPTQPAPDLVNDAAVKALTKTITDAANNAVASATKEISAAVAASANNAAQEAVQSLVKPAR
jgi:carbonic anhydrase